MKNEGSTKNSLKNYKSTCSKPFENLSEVLSEDMIYKYLSKVDLILLYKSSVVNRTLI